MHNISKYFLFFVCSSAFYPLSAMDATDTNSIYSDQGSLSSDARVLVTGERTACCIVRELDKGFVKTVTFNGEKKQYNPNKHGNPKLVAWKSIVHSNVCTFADQDPQIYTSHIPVFKHEEKDMIEVMKVFSSTSKSSTSKNIKYGVVISASMLCAIGLVWYYFPRIEEKFLKMNTMQANKKSSNG